jgi:hypothetical protein
MKLKRWRVTATQSQQFEIEVKAKDRYEARDKADEIDGALWKREHTWCDDWEVTGVDEIK